MGFAYLALEVQDEPHMYIARWPCQDGRSQPLRPAHADAVVQFGNVIYPGGRRDNINVAVNLRIGHGADP